MSFGFHRVSVYSGHSHSRSAAETREPGRGARAEARVHHRVHKVKGGGEHEQSAERTLISRDVRSRP